MRMSDLAVSEDRAPAAWIAPRLGGRFGAVTRFVPHGYPAYVRVCHPVTDHHGRRVTWAQVAQSTGRRAHPLMQWHSLVGSPDPLNLTGSLRRGSDPERGNLEPDALAALCGVLGEHTAKCDDCFFCVWDGYGWMERTQTTLRSRRAGPVFDAETPLHRVFSPAELNRPRVEHPGRSYLLLMGPLTAALRIVSQSSVPQSPNLFWPADHAWCAASEIDFDSTLLGGTAELIKSILDTPSLDAWRVAPEDSLAADADRVN